jgi:PilZ domain-containing protein
MAQASNQRSDPRFSCTGAAEIFQHGSRCARGTVTEIGHGGCYVESGTTMPAGTSVYIRVTVAGIVLETPAVIAWVTPQVGMGARFGMDSAQAATKLAQMLQRVSGETRPGAETAVGQPPGLPVEDSRRTDQPLGAPALALSPEAALRILAQVVQRVRQTGSLNEKELQEIVNAHR